MRVANGDPGQALHDRATRGLPLTAEEQAQLDDWYATLDREEYIAMPDNGEVDSLEVVQLQVRSGVQELLAAAQRIQELSEQNDALRREIAAVQHRLTHRVEARSA